MSESRMSKQIPGEIWCQISGGVLVLLAIVLVGYNFDDVKHSLLDFPLMKLKDLDRINKAEELPRGRVRLDCSSGIELKLRLVGKRYGSDEEKAHYLAVKTGEHYLIAAIPPDRKSNIVEGALLVSNHPNDAEVREFAEKEFPRLRGKLKPFTFSSVVTANPGRDIIVYACLLAVLGAGLFGLSIGMRLETMVQEIPEGAEFTGPSVNMSRMKRKKIGSSSIPFRQT